MSFGGHESFPLRHAWLPKALQQLQHTPDLFSRDDATLLLGVGKNMVASIRHWCLTLGMIEEQGSSHHYVASPLGHAIFGLEGWDPYLEDTATLWLLQWLLGQADGRASTWKLVFSRYGAGTFNRESLLQWLMLIAAGLAPSRVTENSLKRDVEVFVRTYVATLDQRESIVDDRFESPLVELGLIVEYEPRMFEFFHNRRDSLPDELFAYAVLDYWNRTAPANETLSYRMILSGESSPGAMFRLTDRWLEERLDRLPAWTGLQLDETAGSRLLIRVDEAARSLWQQPLTALARYYGSPPVRRDQLQGRGDQSGFWNEVPV